MKEHRKRNASGALCDDPRIAVGPGVLTELQRERKRSQHARQSDTASSHLGSRDARRTGGELCIVANRGRIRAAEGIGGRVKFLPLAWAGMPKTSFRKNSDSLLFSVNCGTAVGQAALLPEELPWFWRIGILILILPLGCAFLVKQ